MFEGFVVNQIMLVSLGGILIAALLVTAVYVSYMQGAKDGAKAEAAKHETMMQAIERTVNVVGRNRS